MTKRQFLTLIEQNLITQVVTRCWSSELGEYQGCFLSTFQLTNIQHKKNLKPRISRIILTLGHYANTNAMTPNSPLDIFPLKVHNPHIRLTYIQQHGLYIYKTVYFLAFICNKSFYLLYLTDYLSTCPNLPKPGNPSSSD